MSEPSSLMCVCGHAHNEHSAVAPLCRHVSCNCYRFRSTLEAEKIQKSDEDYFNLVLKHRCPKCGKGTRPNVEFHANKSWYQWNSCKLGLKIEHLHFTCNVCHANYFEKTVEQILSNK